MEMLSKGKRKTPNDGQGKSGKSMASPGMVNPKTQGAKGGANKGPCAKRSKSAGY